jgi:hypothetical protein
MDRRHFLKTVFYAPLLSPFLARFRTTDSSSRLYLITDSPPLYLPLLLRELRTAGLISGHRFSFLHPSPFDKELLHSLVQTGWESVPTCSQPAFSLSFDRLDHQADPSFALVKDGKIRDIRSSHLASLWMRMKRNQSPSSLLTVVSFDDKPSRLAGRSVSVYQDGHKIDMLDLDKNILKSFSTAKGSIIIKIKDSKARIIESSCREKICCFSPSIYLAGDRIICAPNHFLLDVERTASVDTSIG